MMTDVIRTKEFGSNATDMWGRIGGFLTIDQWHPAVASVEPLADGKKRDITLGDGGHLFETLVDEGEAHYTYTIDEGPLPVADYSATISVRPEGEGCAVEWKASFRADGAGEKEAQDLIGGIFDAGLDNL